MSDSISSFFQLLEGRLGLHPDIVAAAALVIVLALAFLSLYLSSKLRGAREIIEQLGKRLGYEPPYGDGTEIFHQEFRKEIVVRGKEVKIKHLEQRVADLEAEANNKDTSLAAHQQRSKELEEQLQQASRRNEEAAALAFEQAQAHRITVEQFEQRLRDLEVASESKLVAHQQHSKTLEEQLLQASLRNEEVTAQAGEQAHAHQIAIEQFELHIHELEAASSASLTVLQQRANDLEEQLQQAIRRNEEITARAGEQADAHRTAVEQFEQRVRDLEAESNTSLSALQQHSKELEEQLQQVTIQYESERSTSQRETLEQIAEMEQFEQRTREFQAEREGWESGLKTLHARVKELEGQLQQAAGQMAEAVSAAQTAPPLIAEHRDDASETSERLLRRAEWITACAVGTIRPLGLVAAEAYAAAAIAADRHNLDARWLIFELAKLRRASPKPLPSVVEALTTFDERATELFGADLSRAVDIAEREAFERYRAGLNRSALLAVNLNLALRQQTAAKFSPRTQIVQEMKAVLLGRIGGNGRPSSASPEFASP
jgi:DNA repair exonuclease SbcCD ATPase subunit